MPSESLDDDEWAAFTTKLEIAEEEFVQGRPAAFQSLWAQSEDATLCGGFGGVERGWENVIARLTWVSTKYSDGKRTRREITSFVAPDFAYLVQLEVIEFRIPGTNEHSTHELRATMVFRREADGWKIMHRHADSQTVTNPPT